MICIVAVDVWVRVGRKETMFSKLTRQKISAQIVKHHRALNNAWMESELRGRDAAPSKLQQQQQQAVMSLKSEDTPPDGTTLLQLGAISHTQ